MGKSKTPKYRMVIEEGHGKSIEMSWPGNKKPTDRLLEEFIHAYAKSLEMRGANEHISIALGHVPYPVAARIETNKPNPVTIATWKAAMFQCW